MTFIKQLKPWPHKDDEPYSTNSLSTSPNSYSPFNPIPAYEKPRPRLHHFSHSTGAVTTMQKPSSPAPYEAQNTFPANGIFGVSLEESVNCAYATIQIRDKNNQSAVGNIPVIVANCARFLKKDATQVEGIFRLSGSARRIRELQLILTDPAQNYGKDLDWSLFTVHDAANLLRRYLNNLPEPIIPLEFYNKFREPLDEYPEIVEHLQGYNAISATTPPLSAAISPVMKVEEAELPVAAMTLKLSQTTDQTDSIDPIDKHPTDSSSSSEPSPTVSEKPSSENTSEKSKSVDKVQLRKETKKAIREYRDLIDQLPILNQQLLLYILDLLFTFSQESEKNLMPAVNLASIFQPSIISHPDHDMSPKEYHMSRAVTQFLIEQFPKLAGAVRAWTPREQQTTNSLPAPGQRVHSKSMSSVELPISNINGIIVTEELPAASAITANGFPKDKSTADKKSDPAQAKPLIFHRAASRQNSDSFSNPNSGRNSPLASPVEKQMGGFFQALKRGASLTRRRRSSSSTTSSMLGLDNNLSNASLPTQRSGNRNGSIPHQRSGSVHIVNPSAELSEASEKNSEESDSHFGSQNRLRTIPSSDGRLNEESVAEEQLAKTKEDEPQSNGTNPPKKSASIVTITPNSKPSEVKKPLIATMPASSSSEAVAFSPQVQALAQEMSELESSGAETSQSDFCDPSEPASALAAANPISTTKRHRRSISSLLSRRPGSPTLSLSQNSTFRKVDNNRLFSSTSELPVSIDSALASPGAVSISGQSALGNVKGSGIELSTSPRARSMAIFGHSNDSESSVGLESDEDGSTFSGRTDSSRAAGSYTGSSRRNVSRWRRSLMALNIPIPSPDSAGEEIKNPLANPALIEQYTMQASKRDPSNPAEELQQGASSPGSRWLKRLNRRKRTSDVGGAIPVDTSDSGFSS